MAGNSILPQRPPGAVGQFLRLLSINDVYTLDNYARFATAVTEAKRLSKSMQCVVTSHMCGDFMGPCLHTSLDGGVTMMEALNYAKLDYVSLGNHEFDLGKAQLEARMGSYKGKLLNTNGMDDQLKTLPKYDVVEVGGKKVLMVGLCIGDPSIYSANSCPEMKDFVLSTMAAWEDACSKGQHIDIVVPMTHQLIEDDRLLAEQFEMHETMSGKAPVILGGHEHTIFEEEAADSLIVKTGQDATKIACVDIWWTAKGVKCRHVLIDTQKFTSNGPAAAWADGKKQFMKTAMEAPIMALPSKMSTKQVRFEQSDLAGFLLEKLKRGMQEHGVELVLLNGGDIRGRADYEAGPFTLGDLYNELAYNEAMAVVDMKGSKIAEAVKFSREKSGQKPEFLHLDAQAEADKATHEIKEINKKPFDASKTYKVAVQRAVLQGMNEIKPLQDFAKENGVPDEEQCTFAKEVIVSVCMKDMWRQLLSLPPWDPTGGMKTDEIREAMTKAFQKMDKDKSGSVDLQEIEAFLKTNLPQFGSGALALQLFKMADKDGSGRVELAELVSFVH